MSEQEKRLRDITAAVAQLRSALALASEQVALLKLELDQLAEEALRLQGEW